MFFLNVYWGDQTFKKQQVQQNSERVIDVFPHEFTVQDVDGFYCRLTDEVLQATSTEFDFIEFQTLDV